jgi:hypothetical protein
MRLQIAAAVLGCAIAPLAFGGAVLEMVERDLKTAKDTGGQIFYAQDGKARIDHGDTVRSSEYTLFRDQTLYTVDAKSKSFTKVDKAAITAMGARMKSAMSQMQAQMANMPPAQRAQMEAMMGRQMGPPAAKPKRELTNTGKTEKTAGYTCAVWNETRDGVLDTQLCVVPPGSLKGGAELFAVMKEIGKFTRELTDALPRGPRASTDNEYDYERLNGIPVITRDFAGGKAVRETRVTASRSEILGAALFEVPKDYTQRKGPAFDAN